MINVGIIGAGGIVPAFIETTKLVKGYKYVGIASRTKDKVEAVREKYGISYCTTDNDVVLSDPKIDVIYVAVPNATHYEIAKKALENGKHVIMENRLRLTTVRPKNWSIWQRKRVSSSLMR